MDKTKIADLISDSIVTKQRLLADDAILAKIEEAATLCVNALENDHKIWWCGNGGSAADAQHLAAELTGRFYYDRKPLFSEALHVNTSYLTAVANDYSYEQVYSRLMQGKGRSGDILIGLSTSGNSANVVNAFDECRKIGVKTIGMTGNGGGNMVPLSDLLIDVPSKDTPRIQECHMLMGHIICQLIEERIFPR